MKCLSSIGNQFTREFEDKLFLVILYNFYIRLLFYNNFIKNIYSKVKLSNNSIWQFAGFCAVEQYW